MNCAPFDIRDYFCEALNEAESRQVRQHITSCAYCAIELEQLSTTAMILQMVPQEEIPRRIAFVSDRVFAPSPWLRWWTWLRLSGAGAVAAAMVVLAAAVAFHAYRIQPEVRTVRVVERASAGTDQSVVKAEVDRAVAAAVADAEARFDVKLQRVVAGNEKQKRETMDRVAEVLDSMDRRNRVMTVASNAVLENGQ